MNVHHQQQLPDNTNNAQEKLSRILNESQEHLQHLKRSVNESKAFNKKALEYLVNSARFIPLSPVKSVMSFAEIINFVPEEAPEKRGS